MLQPLAPMRSLSIPWCEHPTVYFPFDSRWTFGRGRGSGSAAQNILVHVFGVPEDAFLMETCPGVMAGSPRRQGRQVRPAMRTRGRAVWVCALHGAQRGPPGIAPGKPGGAPLLVTRTVATTACKASLNAPSLAEDSEALECLPPPRLWPGPRASVCQSQDSNPGLSAGQAQVRTSRHPMSLTAGFLFPPLPGGVPRGVLRPGLFKSPQVSQAGLAFLLAGTSQTGQSSEAQSLTLRAVPRAHWSVLRVLQETPHLWAWLPYVLLPSGFEVHSFTSETRFAGSARPRSGRQE